MTPNLPTITFLPDEKQVQVPPNRSVLDCAAKAGVKIPTRCNGVAGCLLCKIEIQDRDAVSAPTDSEKRKLGPQLEQGIRLACQTKVKQNVDINVPEDRLKAVVRAQLARLKAQNGGEVDEWDSI